MSLEEEDDFWNSSDVKAFNFDDEDQTGESTSSTTGSHNLAQPTSTNITTSQHEVKTLGAILAAKPSSNEPFLKPSIIMCNGDKIEALLEHLDQTLTSPTNHRRKLDPKSHIKDVIDRKAQIDFSPFKAKSDKLLLLDCAICSSDGNTITAASIFLSKTLKQSIFIEEMKRRPVAVDHYINYLEMTGRSREANDFLANKSISPPISG